MSRPIIDETHDSARKSWVESANGHSDFPVQNLPFGIFAPGAGDPRAGVAIGDAILDLRAIASLLPAAIAPSLEGKILNALLAHPPEQRRALRRRLSALLSDEAHRSAVEPALHAAPDCSLHLPCRIGDYTDFYVGIHHATNVGRQFRPENPLLPNYKWVPIGYHGRASSIRVSGDPLRRPCGQTRPADSDEPMFGPARRLDYELELGIWMGAGNALGEPLPIGQAGDHIAGYCLLNDWSARDIQAWEYQPLGPFLSKSFRTTISPWIVTAEAMAPFRVPQPPRPEGDPTPLAYLMDQDDQAFGALSVDLEVLLQSETMREQGIAPFRLSRGQATNMYWTAAQLVAHHSSNGCNLSPGDLIGTGTISAPTRDGFGSLLEISNGGREPIELPTGERRSFLADGDTVTLKATASASGHASIGFGPCRATILPARP